jgi:aryl-alcohol dehydrogenase-like predicted oxidoreductase
MKTRGNRSEIVLATKFTTIYKWDWNKHPIKVNYSGNSSKSLHVSVEDSLKKLQTDYIDLLYVHYWYVLSHQTSLKQGIFYFNRGIGAFSGQSCQTWQSHLSWRFRHPGMGRRSI